VDVPEKYSTPAGGKTAEERAELYAAAHQEREDETGELLAKKRERLANEAAERDPLHGETCTMYRERLDKYRKELGRRGGKDDVSTWMVWLADAAGREELPRPVGHRAVALPALAVRVGRGDRAGRHDGRATDKALAVARTHRR
jgi:hypothetical protein